MERYGNIRFTRRMGATLCMLFVAVFILMPMQTVSADTYTIGICNTNNENGIRVPDHNGWYSSPSSFECSGSPLYRWDDVTFANDQYHHRYGIFSIIFQGDMSVVPSNFTKLVKNVGSVNYTLIYNSQSTWSYSDYINRKAQQFYTDSDYNIIDPNSFQSTANYNGSQSEFMNSILDRYVSGDIGANTSTYDSSLGFLAGVELQQIHDKSKEKKGSPDGSGLMETIIYNDKTTTGVDLKNGDYKIEVAWADAYLNAKKTAYYCEDKKKTTICKFDSKLNCKSADSLHRYYYSVLDANKKCKDNSTEGFEPSMFDIITKHLSSQPTYWYRIVTKDNRYSGWVKLGVKGGGVDDITFPQDTYDNEDNKVDADHGGYHKDNSKEAIGSGDSKDEAIEDSVADSQRKDDNNVINSGSSKDLWDSLKEFVKGVESVPQMIADLFSFLPSWCLGLVASGFALMISLMIINFIKS